jgi:MFS transporter, UMF1 family
MMSSDVSAAAPPRDERPVWAPASRGEVASWTMYDFGSSAFNTLMVTFIFNFYFVNVIADDPTQGTVLWTRAVNISALIVAVLMPVLGAAADYGGRKKQFLVGFALLSIAATCVLFFVGQPGMALLAAFVFVVANMGFEASNVFYNSFLPEVSTPRTIGRVSGIGYLVGYVGGLLSLALGLGMVRGWLPTEGDLNVRATILLVAAWYLVFCLPMFLLVKERGERRTEGMATYIRAGFGRIAGTVRHLRDYREAGKLILARMVYNDGLVTIIAMAAIYAGAVLGMELEQVLVMAIGLNVAAGIGAFGFGFIDDRIGGKKTIAISLVLLIVAGIIGISTDTVAGFYAAAALIGLMMGPNQSASRTLLAKLVPEQKHTEFFGLFAFSGKLSSLLGPLAYGTIVGATGDHRLAMSSIILFFGVGLVLLWFVREEEGIAHARKLEAELAGD